MQLVFIYQSHAAAVFGVNDLNKSCQGDYNSALHIARVNAITPVPGLAY